MGKANYLLIKNNAYKYYKQIKRVYCPHLKCYVRYNSKGFWHIIYRSEGKKREAQAQLLRFQLVPKTIKLLNLTHTIQEYDSITIESTVTDHKSKVKKLVKTQFFGYIAIIDGWKIKVIVKRVGNGNPFFWSVIPNWITNNKRDSLKKFQNFKGDLNHD